MPQNVNLKTTSDTPMKLSRLAQCSGYSVSTIYDYLRTGLLHAPQKEGPTHSTFDRSHLDRLNQIRLLKEKKISLAEIRKMVSADDERADTVGETVKQQIVDKALEIFSKRHYENTKISDITRALNMGSGTFYRYFKSKEELLLACLERLPEVMVPREAWDEVLSKTDILGRLKMRGYAMYNAFPSYTGILDYAKLSLGSENKQLAAKAAECIKSLMRPLKRDLKQFITEGAVRPLDEELVAYLLLGINETFFHRLLIDSKYSIDQGFDIIEDFIRHAVSARGENGPAIGEKPPLFRVTDIQGNEVQLEALRFNDTEFLSGKFLEGVLRISLTDVARIQIKGYENGIHADVVNTKGQPIKLTVEPGDRFSGKTEMGEFQVQASRISELNQISLQ